MGDRWRSARKVLTLLLGLMLDWDTLVTRECTWCRLLFSPISLQQRWRQDRSKGLQVGFRQV